MDISHRPQDDFCGVTGFILALRDTLRLRPGGLLWAGHPCGPLLAYTGDRLAFRVILRHFRIGMYRVQVL